MYAWKWMGIMRLFWTSFLHIGNDGLDGYNIWWNLQKSNKNDSSIFEHLYQTFIKTSHIANFVSDWESSIWKTAKGLIEGIQIICSMHIKEFWVDSRNHVRDWTLKFSRPSWSQCIIHSFKDYMISFQTPK